MIANVPTTCRVEILAVKAITFVAVLFTCSGLFSQTTLIASVFSGTHSFRILGSQKLLCFLYPEPVPKKLCDFYWLQLRITCKSGWIAQAE